jgi:hypothetical protein
LRAQQSNGTGALPPAAGCAPLPARILNANNSGTGCCGAAACGAAARGRAARRWTVLDRLDRLDRRGLHGRRTRERRRHVVRRHEMPGGFDRSRSSPARRRRSRPQAPCAMSASRFAPERSIVKRGGDGARAAPSPCACPPRYWRARAGRLARTAPRPADSSSHPARPPAAQSPCAARSRRSRSNGRHALVGGDIDHHRRFGALRLRPVPGRHDDALLERRRLLDRAESRCAGAPAAAISTPSPLRPKYPRPISAIRTAVTAPPIAGRTGSDLAFAGRAGGGGRTTGASCEAAGAMRDDGCRLSRRRAPVAERDGRRLCGAGALSAGRTGAASVRTLLGRARCRGAARTLSSCGRNEADFRFPPRSAGRSATRRSRRPVLVRRHFRLAFARGLGRRRRGLGQSLPPHRIGGQLAPQGGPRKAEHARGQHAVAAAILQRMADELALDLVERVPDEPGRDFAHRRLRQGRRQVRRGDGPIHPRAAQEARRDS